MSSRGAKEPGISTPSPAVNGSMAAAGGGEQRQALLGDAREEELWAHVVSMAPPAGGPSVQVSTQAFRRQHWQVTWGWMGRLLPAWNMAV